MSHDLLPTAKQSILIFFVLTPDLGLHHSADLWPGESKDNPRWKIPNPDTGTLGGQFVLSFPISKSWNCKHLAVLWKVDKALPRWHLQGIAFENTVPNG